MTVNSNICLYKEVTLSLSHSPRIDREFTVDGLLSSGRKSPDRQVAQKKAPSDDEVIYLKPKMEITDTFSVMTVVHLLFKTYLSACNYNKSLSKPDRAMIVTCKTLITKSFQSDCCD